LRNPHKTQVHEGATTEECFSRSTDHNVPQFKRGRLQPEKTVKKIGKKIGVQNLAQALGYVVVIATR
jgi:hypothetical protein